MSDITIHLMARDAKDRVNKPRPPFEPPARECPFCSHSNITVRQMEEPTEHDIEVFWCHCMRCKAEGPAKWTRRLAIDAWNGKGHIPKRIQFDPTKPQP